MRAPEPELVRRRRFGIRAKIVTCFALVVGAIALFVYLYFPGRLEERAFAAIVAKANSIAEIAAYGATAGVVFDDPETVQEMLTAVAQNEDVVYATVTDTVGRVLVHVYGKAAGTLHGLNLPPGAADEEHIHISSAPIEYLERTIGEVRLGLSLAQLQEEVSRSRANVAMVSLLIFAMGIIGVFAVSALVTVPLKRIVHTVEEVSAGDLSRRTGLRSRDELGYLGRAFDRMVTRLEQAHSELRAVNRDLEERVHERTAELEREVEERRRAEEAVRESEHQFRTMIESAAIGVALVNETGRILEVNPALSTMLGYNRDAIMADGIGELVRTADGNAPWSAYRAIVRGEREEVIEEVRCRAVNGPLLWGRAVASAVRDRSGALQFAIVMIENITERKELEERFLQSQKLEAVGRLAGGIAHDFNNLLTTINGLSALLLEEMPGRDALRADVEEIRAAGERAATLTAQLLAFSRKQVVQPEVLDLNAAIHDLAAMLRRMIGEDIALDLELADKLPAIKADRGHITQIVMNLAVNARDAMPRGGKLRVCTSVVALDDTRVARLGTASPGDHVRMTVEDNGHGMDESTMRRIFEPFFTTKAIGKGTGLGLATVYGIVKQAGGGIDVHSQPGRGSTFTIFLPVSAAYTAPPRTAPASAAPGGGETILVVEDEDAVRSLVARVLRTRGYRVLEAASGTIALEVVDAHIGSIDLILTDVIMPGMSGPDLVRRLIAERPTLRVIYMSGYTQDEVLHHGVRQDAASFLEKPMTPGGLAARVREVLDSDSEGSERYGETAANRSIHHRGTEGTEGTATDSVAVPSVPSVPLW